jgi:hypothetical protein
VAIQRFDSIPFDVRVAAVKKRCLVRAVRKRLGGLNLAQRGLAHESTRDVRVCACVCVRARARVCVCVWWGGGIRVDKLAESGVIEATADFASGTTNEPHV